MTSPDNGTVLTALPAFSWNNNAHEAGYLFVGSTLGGKDYASQYLTVATTSLTIPGLPFDNSTIYVRLWSYNAPTWTYNDYVYTARSGSATDLAVMTTPANNGDNVFTAFEWTTVPGVSYYWLSVGTTGPGSFNLFHQPSTPAGNTSAIVSGLSALSPGTTVYVRLYTVFGPIARYQDYNYNTTVATMTTPANNGDTLAKPAQFAWTNDGASQYYLFIGSSQGAKNYASLNVGANTSATVPGLPSDNSTVYVRLWGLHGSSWGYSDYNYLANGSGSTDLAQIYSDNVTNPLSDNDTLDNATGSIMLIWDNATYADYYWLTIGSSTGASDYYNKKQFLNLSATVSGLPSAATVYVRLYTVVGTVSRYVDSFYKTP